MRYDKIDAKLFIENRKRFVELMKPNSIAVFHSADLMPRNADQNHPFKQNGDMFYLSGIDQEECNLIIFPDHPVKANREVLFVRETSELIAIWEGAKVTKEQGTDFSGIENVQWSDNFMSVLSNAMHYAEHIYINLNENDRAVNDVPYKDVRFANEMRGKYPLHKFERSGPLMSELRMIKSDTEFALMQTACDITEKAFRNVLKVLKPGVKEYEIEAELISSYIANRGNGHAYEPIVASGKNACVLHYIENSRECKDGDLLLIDSGADYANYSADMTRTIPVNGKFSPRQKDVYNAVLRVMKGATNNLTPGITMEEWHAETIKLTENELVGLGLMDKSAVGDKKSFKKYFMHGTGHFLGIDVHDIGNRYKPMRENMVFTVEPGIYIPDESIGVRIENNVIVKSGDNFDLMRNIPREVEEIEDLMNE